MEWGELPGSDPPIPARRQAIFAVMPSAYRVLLDFLKEFQCRFGHTQESITLDVYGHLIPTKQQVVASLEKV